MRQKHLLIVLSDILSQWIPSQLRTIPAQQRGAGQVDFLDVAIFIQRDIARRSGIIKINIAIAVGFQPSLCLL